MKVSELIAILLTCPQDMTVCTASDSMVARCDFENAGGGVLVVPKDDGFWEMGVYLCASTSQLDWHLGELDEKCEYPIPGYRAGTEVR